MSTFRLKLMHAEAAKRLSDAELLIEADPLGSRRYDSDHLLKLLGVELLLKFVFEVEVGKEANSYGHDYPSLFCDLPTQTQDRIIELCGKRVGPSEFSSKNLQILKEWSRNFVALRYPFERYKNMTEEQYRATSARWLQKGAKLESATFRFYPSELKGILYALQMIANLHARAHFGEEFVHDIFCA